MDGDAGRELAAGRDDLAALEAISVDLERRHGVAARVDRDQDGVPRVVHERALRGEMVGLGSGSRNPAVAARRVGAGLRQRAVARAVVDDVPVSGHLVRLGPDDGSSPSVRVPVSAPVSVPVVRIGGLGARERRDRGHEHEQGSMSHGFLPSMNTAGVPPRRAKNTAFSACYESCKKEPGAYGLSAGALVTAQTGQPADRPCGAVPLAANS